MDLLLIQNTTNTICLSLSDVITLTATPVYFLFRLKNHATNSEVLFTAPDVSTNTVRTNKFYISLTGSSNQNFTAGTISLHPDGDWGYEVYEMYSQTNLFLSGTSGTILNRGIAKVSGANLSYISYNYTGQSSQYNYYEG